MCKSMNLIPNAAVTGRQLHDIPSQRIVGEVKCYAKWQQQFGL